MQRRLAEALDANFNRVDSLVARKVARTTNLYPSIVFLAPEVQDAYAAVGLPPGLTGYFAGRAAPLGAVPAEVVIATFYSFQPELVRSAIPAAWALASPAVILQRRLAAVDAALRRVLGEQIVGGDAVREAAGLARAAALECQPEARTLYAGHAALPWPDEPHLALWHALTLLREHRGDGHLIALQAAGYSGCDAMVMTLATRAAPAELVATRAWSDTQWAASLAGLRERGLVDADGRATEAGRAHREKVECETDRLALAPLRALGLDGCQRLRELVRPLSSTIAERLLAGGRLTA